MNKLYALLCILIIAFFISCDNGKNKISILKVTELGSAKLSDTALIKVLENKPFLNIEIDYTLMEDTALSRLRNKQVDLVILPNNTPINANDLEVRTIVPLLPRILLVLTFNISDENQYDLKTVLEENTLIYEDLSRLDSLFFEKLFISFGINKQMVHGHSANNLDIEQWKDSAFVFIGLTHLHNPLMKKLLDNGADFYSIGEISELNKGSAAEGFILGFPSATPFILPKSFYKGKPKNPILTISILDILVCREDLDETLVYEITKNLIEKKSQLIQYDNIYSMLDMEFNTVSSSFPIHEGTRQFIERDKPPIWSRYASLIWPFVSMLAILIGLVASLQNRMKQRQKHRIETYYGALLRIRKKALKNKSKSNELLISLENILIDAIEALGDEKLIANESFSIFLSLYSDIKEELMQNIHS
jgi:hypothetical protein